MARMATDDLAVARRTLRQARRHRNRTIRWLPEHARAFTDREVAAAERMLKGVERDRRN